MNIRVDLNTPIKDGTEVVFRSPVDCSQITGLIVYYRENGKTSSKEFALADAHGNNVGDIDHLFAENVVVKVILDVTSGMAFVQNADTNAYLEGRFNELDNVFVGSYGKVSVNDFVAAKNAGKMCFLAHSDGLLYTMAKSMASEAHFYSYDHANGMLKRLSLYPRGGYALEPIKFVRSINGIGPQDDGSITLDIGSGGSGGGGECNVFLGTTETTYAEFSEAKNAGKVCFLETNSGYIPMVGLDNSGARFSVYDPQINRLACKVLGTNNAWSTTLIPVIKTVNGKTPNSAGNVEIPVGGNVDLSGYAQKSELPTKVSQLENDKGYLTEHQDLSAYALKTELPSKTSDLTNDSGFITGYTETDPTVPAWAKNPTKPSYTKSEVGLGDVDNVKQYSASNPPPYPVTSVNGKTGAVTLDASAVGARPSTWIPSASDVGALPASTNIPTKVSQLTNDKGYLTEHQDISGKLDASELPTAINTALAQAKSSGEFDGKTPVKGTDYWTEADKEAILHEVMQALATPVYGRVDEENNIIITAELADGTYTLKYENADGTKVDIGIIELGGSDVVVDESGPIAIEWAGGVKLDKNNGTEGSGSNYGASQSIAYDSTYQYTIATTNNYATQAAICWYGDSGYLGWNDAIAGGANPGSQVSAILTPLDGATSFRVRAYTIYSDATNRDKVLAYISVRKDLIQ